MIPLKKIFEARRLILSGYSVKEISSLLKMSESSVRLYTKAERKRVKERKMA